jgi:23S rRNA (cytidine1920-2'-O)/16S rRNA (cytidine1409-2'-O)-methyltransferase
VVRRRLDTELVRRGLARSRQHARTLIDMAEVLVSGSLADKPGRLVADADPIVVRHHRQAFVSRGGDKLDAALTRFAIDVRGRRALDAGASTGGFTDCLLQRGALHVVAVDVGYGQLDPRLRTHQRVTVVERTNIRLADPRSLGGSFEVVVADLSFISLTAVAPLLAGELAAPGAELVLLVKPQFEAGRAEARRGLGVIRDPAIRRAALGRVASALHAAGASIMGAMPSPVLGPAGNVEFLLHARAHAAERDLGPAPAALEAMLDAAAED